MKNYFYCVVILIVSLLFIIVGHKYRDSIQKPLKYAIVKLPKSTIDLWSISHVLLYAILAYLLPTKLFELMILGIIWELTEDLLASRENTQIINCKAKNKSIFSKIWCKGSIENDYWYAKHDDIMWNCIGIITGYFIHKITKSI